MPLIVMPTLATALGSLSIKQLAQMIRRSNATSHRILNDRRAITLDEFNALMRKLPDDSARALASVAFDGTPYRVQRVENCEITDHFLALRDAVDLTEQYTAAAADRVFTRTESENVLACADKLQSQIDAIRSQMIRKSARLAE